jgi:ABC-type transport system involved in cytochrome c biogenesis permease component
MTTVHSSRDANLAEILRGRGEGASDVPAWLQRLDHWATRGGDMVNPILVKETRQALKSRQFVVTFSLLLFASLAWTIVGSVLMMPQIYYTPSAVPLLIGYYLVLAVPMLLVVPLAAYRSLEAEVDDGTLELLSVTALSPRLIVTGKLASAALQMLLYFVALFPCVAYAYTLRGVDLATLGLLMGTLIFGGLGLTMVALFFAPVSSGRTGQISGLLAVLAILLAAEFALGTFAVELIQYGLPSEAEDVAFGIVAALALGGTIAAMLLMATVAKLTPESENRSTGVRIAVLVHM